MKVLFISLGCDKNRIDSEKMLGILMKDGFTITDDEYDADIIVVNTCCFIGDAKEESVNTLLEMARMKEEGKCRVLVACGCLAERYKDEFFAELPEVDCIVGTTAWDKICDAVKAALSKKISDNSCHISVCENVDRLPVGKHERTVTTGGHYAYLKIAEGCGKKCTYCAIPSVRGRYRSVPMEELLDEAKDLVDGGVKELVVVAQETTLYGVDLYGKKMLPELLKRLAEIEELHWIRLLYCYPEEIDGELIQIMKNEPKICNYLDIPIQHINDTILKKMGRRTTGSGIRNLISHLRDEIPDIALRTTLIVGFPGETDEQFEELLEFVEEAKFDRLGVFSYSPEEGTKAAQMPDQIEQEIKDSRRDRIMAAQQAISLECGRSLVGQTMEVFVEGEITEEGTGVGRSYRDAPDVDGYVFFGASGIESGRFVDVEIVSASEYDLIGEMI